MTRCIVCGFDETSGSRHAASIAARLARDLDSSALLVYVLEKRGPLARIPSAPIGRARRVRRTLRTAAEEHCFPERTTVRVTAGDPALTLMSVAGREDAELIVVSTGGRSTVGAGVMGSVASTLVRDAPCPVVVVPSATIAPLDTEGMRSVVCGVAGEDTDPEVLRLAEDLAVRLHGELHVVHAYEPGDADSPREAEQRLDLALEELQGRAYGTVVPLQAAEALTRVAAQRAAGLIVVGSRGRSKLGSALHGSVPTELAVDGRTAVVVLPLETRLEPGSGHYEVIAGAT
jgi:nucleotide-binding universal stress UspA family protein